MNSNHFSLLVCPMCKTSLSNKSDQLICKNNHKIINKNNILNLIPEGRKTKLTTAQKSGSWKITSFLYERIWRYQSLSIMTIGKFSVSKELQILHDFCSTLPTQSYVCDLTCSTGLYGRFILENFINYNMYFLDYSETMLIDSQKRNSAPERSCYVQNYAENITFIENSLDAVVCGASWNEITKTEETISNVYQSLKSGGKTFWMGILKSEKRIGTVIQNFASVTGGLHFDSAEFVEKSFLTHGFKNIRLSKYGTIFIMTAEK